MVMCGIHVSTSVLNPTDEGRGQVRATRNLNVPEDTGQWRGPLRLVDVTLVKTRQRMSHLKARTM